MPCATLAAFFIFPDYCAKFTKRIIWQQKNSPPTPSPPHLPPFLFAQLTLCNRACQWRSQPPCLTTGGMAMPRGRSTPCTACSPTSSECSISNGFATGNKCTKPAKREIVVHTYVHDQWEEWRLLATENLVVNQPTIRWAINS